MSAAQCTHAGPAAVGSTYRVGNATVGIPRARLSNDVFDPPNGKGTSATSPRARRDRNAALPGWRGTNTTLDAVSGIVVRKRARSCAPSQHGTGSRRSDGSTNAWHRTQGDRCTAAATHRIGPFRTSALSDDNHRGGNTPENASQHCVEVWQQFERAVQAHVHHSIVWNAKPSTSRLSPLCCRGHLQSIVPTRTRRREMQSGSSVPAQTKKSHQIPCP